MIAVVPSDEIKEGQEKEEICSIESEKCASPRV